MPATRSVRLVVVMDPIDSIKPAKDTTLAMMLAAQKRGWELWYAEQHDLWLRDGVAFGRLRPVRVRDDLKDWFELGEAQTARLASFDAVLMRKDPPFDMEYIYTTYILDRAEQEGALIVNRPQGLRDMNEKVYTAWFPQCCAPTLITRNMADMHAFLREHGRAVCKPLHGMGGRSIFVIDQGDKNANVIFETLRNCAEVPSGDRHDRGFARAGHRWRTRTLRARTHPNRARQPRQPRSRRKGPGARTH
jgi:glutathione synthase